jgi:hypothetical protein
MRSRRPVVTSTPDPENVGEYLVSSRSLLEYQAMFTLTESDFRGRILDCPGGASSFTAEATEFGADSTAVDPVYALSIPDLRGRVMGEPERGSAHTAAGVDRYVWNFYGTIEGHRAMRHRAASCFVDDIEEHPERYVPGSLPVLPFEDGQFDLVLSSHFLFTYVDRLDIDFHHRALVEMHRVCRHEVRVFPLLDQGGHSLDAMTGELIAALLRDGIGTEICEVPYEFQRGGNRMLVLSGG